MRFACTKVELFSNILKNNELFRSSQRLGINYSKELGARQS